MSRIAMFGGSFNPVHQGHKALVHRMIEAFSLDRVYVIPTFCTPLKDNTPMVTASHRFNMCKLAFADVDRVVVSDIEIIRQGKSYTVDTLCEISKLHPDDELFLIVGADSFMQLPLWFKAEEIFCRATVLTIARGEVDYQKLLAQKTLLQKEFNANTFVLEKPVAQVSSTQVRNLIFEKADFSHLLSNEVSEYIIRNGLYDYGA